MRFHYVYVERRSGMFDEAVCDVGRTTVTLNVVGAIMSAHGSSLLL